MKNLETKLDQFYTDFFKKCEIDEKTGIVKSKPNLRFATKIAIGDNYLNSEKKILFVSFDIGKDEYFVDNTYQNFKQRRESVTQQIPSNPHMTGVYGTALYFLKDQYNWEKSWQLLEEKNQFFREIFNSNKDVLPQEVLTHISLINFYNFVSVGRTERTGGNDRIFVNETLELELLTNIINSIKPDIIVVQSTTLRNYFKKIKPKISDSIEIFVGYHPSIFGRGIKYRIPKNYIENLKKGKM
jgi:hypothetical protein